MFRGARDWVLKKLCGYLLHRTLGRYLCTQLDLQQLLVKLDSGTIELKSIQLNCDVLNTDLVSPTLPCIMRNHGEEGQGFSFALSFHLFPCHLLALQDLHGCRLRSCHVGCIRAQLVSSDPSSSFGWGSVLGIGGCLIELDQVSITLVTSQSEAPSAVSSEPSTAADVESVKSCYPSETTSAPQFRKKSFTAAAYSATMGALGMDDLQSLGYSSISDGVAYIANSLQALAQSMQVVIRNLSVNVELPLADCPRPLDGTNTAIKMPPRLGPADASGAVLVISVHVESVDYQDVSCPDDEAGQVQVQVHVNQHTSGIKSPRQTCSQTLVKALNLKGLRLGLQKDQITPAARAPDTIHDEMHKLRRTTHQAQILFGLDNNAGIDVDLTVGIQFGPSPLFIRRPGSMDHTVAFYSYSHVEYAQGGINGINMCEQDGPTAPSHFDIQCKLGPTQFVLSQHHVPCIISLIEEIKQQQQRQSQGARRQGAQGRPVHVSGCPTSTSCSGAPLNASPQGHPYGHINSCFDASSSHNHNGFNHNPTNLHHTPYTSPPPPTRRIVHQPLIHGKPPAAIDNYFQLPSTMPAASKWPHSEQAWGERSLVTEFLLPDYQRLVLDNIEPHVARSLSLAGKMDGEEEGEE
jgi:hypothetical protein